MAANSTRSIESNTLEQPEPRSGAPRSPPIFAETPVASQLVGDPPVAVKVAQPPVQALTLAAWSFALLAIEGASVALGIWVLRSSKRLLPYVTDNVLPASARSNALKSMLAGALVALAFGVALIFVRKPRSLELTNRLSFRCAPLCLAAFVPLLLNWRLWVDRDLNFLVLASVFLLSLQGLLRLSLGTASAIPETFAARHRARLRSLIERISAVRWLPLALVCVAALGYAIYFSIHTLNTHYRIETSVFDLGCENNLIWNAVHGNGPMFRMTPFGERTHAGHHMTFITYVFAAVYVFAQRCETLLIIQAVLLASAAVSLYFLAKRTLGAWVASLLGILFLFYAPLHGANLYDFHYQPLGVPFLFLTLFLIESGRYRWAVLTTLLTLSVREDMGAMLVVIGSYLLVGGQRPRAGLILALVGACYFITLKFFVMPLFLHGQQAFLFMYEGLLPEGESGYGGVLKTAFANPAFTLNVILDKEKLIYVLQILAPLGFLTVRRPIGLLLLLPGFFFALLSTNYEPLRRISFQYTAYWIPFVFIGTVASLTWIKQQAASGRLPHASWRAWLLVLPVAMLITSYQHGAILQHNTARSHFIPYRFGITDADRRRHDDLYALIAHIPPDAKVVSAEWILPQVSSRADSYTLRYGPVDAEYMILAFAARPDEAVHIREVLGSKSFGVIEARGEYALAKRGHPTDKNQDVLNRLR